MSSIARDPIFCRQTADGSVLSGTPEGLIGRLLDHPPNDNEYRETFLLSYAGFTTAEFLRRFLVTKYDQADKLPGKDRGPLRYSILKFMEDWLIYRYICIEGKVLTQLGQFAISVDSSPTISEVGGRVAALVDAQVTSRISSPIPSPVSVSTRGPCGWNYADLATALTILEGENFACILPADYITHLMHPSRQGNVRVASVVHRKIVTWVKEFVLSQKDYEARARQFEFFVNTANECNRLCNFASMIAIIDALQSLPITNLCATEWKIKRQAPHCLKTLAALRGLIGESPSYSPYKRTLEGTKGPCVPWVDVHLYDLHMIFENHPETIDYNSLQLVNWRRYTEFSAWVKNLMRHQPPKLERSQSLAYLETKLSTLGTNSNVDDWIHNRCRSLAGEEKAIFNRRIPQLKSLGFSK